MVKDMNPLGLVKLTEIMELTSGSPDVVIGLLDGPVATDHPEFTSQNIRRMDGSTRSLCAKPKSLACSHGTFVASILSAKRGSSALAICPGCTLLLRPIFFEPACANELLLPTATPEELAGAVVECVNAGARVLNLSVGLAQPSLRAERELDEALNYALRRGTMVVAAAGNQGAVASSAITRHPGVIPVVGFDRRGRPMSMSNIGSSIGRRGLGAPGEGVAGLSAESNLLSLSGTSIATPFVTGAIALLWSIFPEATAADLKLAVTNGSTPHRTSVVPPLLNALAAYQFMVKANSRRRIS